MNVSLTPQLEEILQKKVKSGMYASVSEVMRAALRLLEQQDRLRELQLQELRNDIMVGVKQADNGESSTFDEKELNSLKEECYQEQLKRE